LRGRFDCGKEQPHYVLMPLSSEEEWKNYIEVMKSSSVRCFEVVVENLCTPYVVGVDVEPVENLTQDEELQGVVVREVDMSCEPGALNDEFDEEAFDDDDDYGDGIHDMHDISEGSEDDEVGVASEDEDDLTSGQTSSVDVLLEDEYRSEPSSEDESDCCEAGFRESIGVLVDGSIRVEYSPTKLSQLKAVHVEVPSVPNFMHISMVDQVVCDSGLMLLADDVAESDKTEIKKGMVFDTLEHLKYFLMDYAVRFHRPYNVIHCDKNKRYTIICKFRCGWGVWARRQTNDKWKIRNVKQPHTC
jgi:hypothetical protein